jgi:uncharacterized protein YndB with AHSA1/START domain
MATSQKTIITIEANIIASAEKVWNAFTDPEQIIQWNQASDDWHTTKAENDLKEGGRFNYRMEAKDGSMGFDFTGRYTTVNKYKLIEYELEDSRKVAIHLQPQSEGIKVIESFEAEQIHPVEMQRDGWQAILNNFKKYVETLPRLQTIHFNILINAPVEKVFEIMLSKEHWNGWTDVFSPGSTFEGSWDKGEKMLFLDGNGAGMVSRIEENIPNKFISIEHIGFYENGIELTSGPQVEPWTGAHENYSFTYEEGMTKVQVDLDTGPAFIGYMKEIFPKALNKLKEICEK